MKRYNPLFYYLALANFTFFLGNSLYILFPVYLKSMGASESYIGIMNNADKIFIIITAITIGSLPVHMLHISLCHRLPGPFLS